MRYVVSFDLKRPKQDDKRKAYLKITKTLNGIGKKVQRTHWLIDSKMSAPELLDYLKLTLKIFKSSDRILIVKTPTGRDGVCVGVACQKLLSDLDSSDFL